MKHPISRLSAGFFLCCLISIPQVGVAHNVLQEQSKPEEFWLLQARLITDDILKETSRLTRPDQTLLRARLAATWWHYDRQVASSWLRKAIDEAEPPLDAETKEVRRKCFATLRTLLAIVAPLDQNSSNRIVSLLTADDVKTTPEDGSENATALVQAALNLVETDPTRAATLGSLSLRLGKSLRFPSLLSRLRARNRALGDSLFFEALSSPRLNSDLLASLTLVAFTGPAPSDQLRKQTLLAISREFVGTLSNVANVKRGCSFASVVTPLLDQFDQLVPEAASTVRSGLIRCRKLQPAPSETASDNQRLKTVDDFLEIASKASTTEDRVDYLSQAASLAAQENNFVRALGILDDFTEEERRQLNSTWDNWRWDFASSAAIARLKQGDRHGMTKIIAATPAALRAFVQIAVAEELANYGDPPGAVELLDASRKALLKIEAANLLEWYLSLLRRYARLKPAVGPEVFREFVQTINRTTHAENNDGTTTQAQLSPIDLPTSLIQADVLTVKELMSSIQDSSVRARARLGLVKASLDLGRPDNRSEKGPGGNGDVTIRP